MAGYRKPEGEWGVVPSRFAGCSRIVLASSKLSSNPGKEKHTPMPKFRLSAIVGVSAFTTVDAETEGEAIEIAEGRQAVIGGINSGESEDESWIVDEADGEPTDIKVMK